MGELSEVLRLLHRIEDRLEQLEDRMLGLAPPPVPMTPVQIELIRVFTPVPMPAEANDSANDATDAELAEDSARDAADQEAAADDLPPIEGIYEDVEAHLEAVEPQPAPAPKKSRKRGA